MKRQDFLFELGMEEMPPKLIEKLSEDLKDNFIDELKLLKIAIGEVKAFSTPRRIALYIKDLECQQKNQKIEKKGPAIDSPKKAIEGFAKSCGINSKNLEKDFVGNKQYYFFRYEKKVQTAEEFLPIVVNQAIKKIPIKKPMYWGDAKYCFIRPVKWLVMLLGKNIINAEIMGIESGRKTQGLRTDNPKCLSINEANQYQKLMFDNFQIEVDFTSRKNTIRQQIELLAKKNKAIAIIDDELLNEVCSLVEHPVVFLAKFNKKFLTLPEEVLISAMKKHQKYFHMTDINGNLLANFISVANTKSKDLSAIIKGNERVILPRLEDSDFFWKNDIAKSSEKRLLELENVLFMQSLGSIADKSRRMAKISEIVATEINVDKGFCIRAAILAKNDLVSEMVGEFADLQGVMGAYYAMKEGETKEIANAIKEHYKPRFAGDLIPDNKFAMVVAIADKIDTITAIYTIGKQPTGSKDPYALRRLALGLVRIFIESELDIDLKKLIKNSLKLHNNSNNKNLSDQIYQFIIQRLKSYYVEKGIDANVFRSVLAINPNSPFDLHKKVQTLDKFVKEKEVVDLIQLNKRICNILKDCKNDITIDITLLTKDVEINIFEVIQKTREKLEKEKDYGQNIKTILEIKDVIYDFFDNATINHKDLNIRNNRMGLIKQLRDLFLYIGDISYLSKSE